MLGLAIGGILLAATVAFLAAMGAVKTDPHHHGEAKAFGGGRSALFTSGFLVEIFFLYEIREYALAVGGIFALIIAVFLGIFGDTMSARLVTLISWTIHFGCVMLFFLAQYLSVSIGIPLGALLVFLFLTGAAVTIGGAIALYKKYPSAAGILAIGIILILVSVTRMFVQAFG